MQAHSVSLTAFLLIVLCVAFIGSEFQGGAWLQTITLPAWSPPAWVFIVAWPVFYLFMALLAWSAWQRRGDGMLHVLAGWMAALLLLIAWFWLLFGLNRLGWAMAVLILPIAALAYTGWKLRPDQPSAGWLMLPVLIWLVFLWAWNFTVWSLNGGGAGSLFS